MKDVFTIHQADNGIMLKSDEYVEVMEWNGLRKPSGMTQAKNQSQTNVFSYDLLTIKGMSNTGLIFSLLL